jgi:pyruvate kinase
VGGWQADDQVPINAGHEFYVTTDDQYASAGTAEQIYMDYVSYCFLIA